MITLAFTDKDVDNTHTYELTCTATGGSPFVMDSNDDFLNIASPADMLLIPDVAGGSLYRTDTITMIFRAKSVRQLSQENIEEQIAELNSIDLTAQTNQVLFSNLP